VLSAAEGKAYEFNGSTKTEITDLATRFGNTLTVTQNETTGAYEWTMTDFTFETTANVGVTFDEDEAAKVLHISGTNSIKGATTGLSNKTALTITIVGTNAATDKLTVTTSDFETEPTGGSSVTGLSSAGSLTLENVTVNATGGKCVYNTDYGNSYGLSMFGESVSLTVNNAVLNATSNDAGKSKGSLAFMLKDTGTGSAISVTGTNGAINATANDTDGYAMVANIPELNAKVKTEGVSWQEIKSGLYTFQDGSKNIAASVSLAAGGTVVTSRVVVNATEHPEATPYDLGDSATYTVEHKESTTGQPIEGGAV